MDSVLIIDARVHEIFRGKAKANLAPMHPDLVARIIEAPPNTTTEGDLWDGKVFSKPEPTPESPLSIEQRVAQLETDVANLMAGRATGA